MLFGVIAGTLENDSAFHCLICNLPLRSQDFDSTCPGLSPKQREDLTMKTTWWSDILLLNDPDDEVERLEPSLGYEQFGDYPEPIGEPQKVRPRSEASEIAVVPGQCLQGSSFRLSPFSDLTRREVNVDRALTEPATFDGRVWIPVHRACLDIAQKVFESSPNAYVKDMRGLWTALHWRLAISATNRQCGPEPNYTIGRTHFYAPWWNWWSWRQARARDSRDGPGQSVAEFVELYQTFASSPYESSGYKLTEDILRNLEQCPRGACSEGDAHSLTTRFLLLPGELQDAIVAEIRPVRGLPRATTRLLPQEFWREQLKSGSKGLLPWLWDIDAELVDAKASETCTGGEGYEWNWELLVRKLSCNVDFGVRLEVPEDADPWKPHNPGATWIWTGYRNDLEHVPAGLHNRRRIWQLMEEMFVGDVLPSPPKGRRTSLVPRSPEKKHIQLHWTKSGDLMEPTKAKWLPSFDIAEDFVRRIGGDVYMVQGRQPLQYWQNPAKFSAWRSGRNSWSSQVAPKTESRPAPATVDEIITIIRGLDYPV
ncbi:hypothetical protein F5X99DRAFT_85453 [Biscogniauxia marginata]|nr:hypothetical protein F5X99DRAFT_85453 [Biscogniauxia marginata]